MNRKLKSFILTLMLALASLSMVACTSNKDKEDNKPVEDIEDKKDEKDKDEDSPKDPEENKDEDKDEKPEVDKEENPEEDKKDEKDEDKQEKPEEDKNEAGFNQKQTDILISEINNRNNGEIAITEDNNDSGQPVDLSKLQAVAKFDNDIGFGWVVKYDDNKIGIISHYKAASHDKFVFWGEKAVMNMAPNFSGLKTGSAQEFKDAVEPILSNETAFPDSKIEYCY